jgi:hypothetical protein
VEIDEMYIGGKSRWTNAKFDANDNIIPSIKPKAKRERKTKKTPVVSVKERSTKRVYARVMFPNVEGKNCSTNNRSHH